MTQPPTRLVSSLSLTLSPSGERDQHGIAVQISEAKWDPQVRIRFPVPVQQANEVQAVLPLPGPIAPAPGGEAKTRGRAFTRDDFEPPSDGFDPWALAQESTLRIESLEDRRLMQLMAAVSVHAYREVIERTGKFVPEALDTCHSHRLPPPTWLTDAFHAAVQQVVEGRVGSLDEAFKRPRITDKERIPAAKRLELRARVMRALIDEVVRSPKQAINQALYSVVGDECGIKGWEVYAIYKEAKADGFQDLAYLRERLLAEENFTRRGRRRSKPGRL